MKSEFEKKYVVSLSIEFTPVKIIGKTSRFYKHQAKRNLESSSFSLK